MPNFVFKVLKYNTVCDFWDLMVDNNSKLVDLKYMSTLNFIYLKKLKNKGELKFKYWEYISSARPEIPQKGIKFQRV